MSDALSLAAKVNLAGARAVRSRDKQLSHDQFQMLLQTKLQDVMPAIIDKAQEQALEGDKDARTWLMDRAYGKAPQTVAVTGSVQHTYSGQVNIAVLAAQAALQLKESKT